MMRLSQDKKYQETIEKYSNRQVDNKFEFYKEDGGYINKGVYILYYDTDCHKTNQLMTSKVT
jgi:hypothetical protein